MQIKKYSAATLKEATLLMKHELGDEAIILSTRMVENVKGKQFEITAGFEKRKSEEIPAGEVRTEKEAAALRPASGSLKPVNGDTDAYSAELLKIKEKLNAPAVDTRKLKKTVPPDIQPAEDRVKKLIDLEADLKEVVEVLNQRELQKSIIQGVLDLLKKNKHSLTSSNIDNYVLNSIASLIPTYNLELKKQKKPKCVSLVGPTGVGKTTCIAKLAVIGKIIHNLDIGLISIDTYRLGAIDQLRIFSEISDIDLLIAYDQEDLKKYYEKFRSKDVIFIDTAGRSQKNSVHLKEMQSCLDAIPVDETFLVMSSTSTTRNMFDTADKFKIFDYSAFIFSKIDEAAAFGSIANVTANFNIPVAYLTNGQIIPDDIIAADADFIANMIYTGKTSK